MDRDYYVSTVTGRECPPCWVTSLVRLSGCRCGGREMSERGSQKDPTTKDLSTPSTRFDSSTFPVMVPLPVAGLSSRRPSSSLYSIHLLSVTRTPTVPDFTTTIDGPSDSRLVPTVHVNESERDESLLLISDRGPLYTDMSRPHEKRLIVFVRFTQSTGLWSLESQS